MVHLQDTAGPSSAAFVFLVHIEVDASTTRGLGCRVVRGGSLEEDRGRQLGGIDRLRGESAERERERGGGDAVSVE